MAVTIPIDPGVPFQAFQVELDGQTYGLELRWNFRSSQWALSLFDAEGIPAGYNIGVVVDYPLGRRLQNERMPPGFFIAKDTAGDHAEAGLDDLGDRVQLLYFSADELP